MEIIPAIDLKNGHCVRLYQGNYDQETVYSEDPIDVALRWQSMGVPRLHVVDLDAAGNNGRNNLELVKDISRIVQIPVQLGGGVRDVQTLKDLLKAGIDRVVLGTAAVETPRFVELACKSYRESIIVGIDVWDGYIAIRGWKTRTNVLAVDFVKSMIKLGVRRFIYTDISRDGTLTEPNFTGVADLIRIVRYPVVAAGGITSLSHLHILRQIGVEGAIIGKALYTGNINLKKALAENG